MIMFNFITLNFLRMYVTANIKFFVQIGKWDSEEVPEHKDR